MKKISTQYLLVTVKWEVLVLVTRSVNLLKINLNPTKCLTNQKENCNVVIFGTFSKVFKAIVITYKNSLNSRDQLIVMFGNFLIISNKEFSRKCHKAVRNLLILAFLML